MNAAESSARQADLIVTGGASPDELAALVVALRALTPPAADTAARPGVRWRPEPTPLRAGFRAAPAWSAHPDHRPERKRSQR